MSLACDVWRVSQDEGDDDYFEDGNLFSRLEEIRAHLEKELGLEILRKAYEAVQVLCNLIAPWRGTMRYWYKYKPEDGL